MWHMLGKKGMKNTKKKKKEKKKGQRKHKQKINRENQMFALGKYQ